MVQAAQKLEMDGGFDERISELKEELNADINIVKEKLSKPITKVQSGVANFMYPLTEKKAMPIDEAAAEKSRETFPNFFPPTFIDRLAYFLSNPREYIDSIEEYEKICPFPELDFSTQTDEFRFSTDDPMRKMEEYMIEKAILDFLSSRYVGNGKQIRVLDMGTGSGRIARCSERILRDVFDGNTDKYAVFGIDIIPENIEGAKKVDERTGSEIVYLLGDMNDTKLETGSISIATSVASTYLNATHRRPREFSEMVRLIDEDGGVVSIVSPNDSFSCKEYGDIMLRTAWGRYLNPFNILVTSKLGHRVLYTERLGEARPDMGFPGYVDVGRAIKDVLHAEIIDDYAWPESGGPAVFNVYTFRVNGKTKKALGKYIDFMEAKNDAKPIVA